MDPFSIFGFILCAVFTSYPLYRLLVLGRAAALTVAAITDCAHCQRAKLWHFVKLIWVCSAVSIAEEVTEIIQQFHAMEDELEGLKAKCQEGGAGK